MQVVGTVFDGEHLLARHVVTWDADTVTDVSPESHAPGEARARTELGEDILVPGFVDIQVNGGGGELFNDSPDPATIGRIGAAHRRFGTVAFLPTLITDTSDTMRKAADAVERAIADAVPGVIGIHFEGPCLNPARAGVHDKTLFRRLDSADLDLLTGLRGGVTVVTLAPELVDPLLIRRLADAGVIVCAGHSAADYGQTRHGIAAGVAGFTHLFNAMTPLHSREPGMTGAAIDDDTTWFGIIADGHHVHPAAFSLAVAAKKRGGSILVTDAMAPLGTAQRSFRLGGRTIAVNGTKCTTGAGALAGSNLDMMSAVCNAARFAGIEWVEALRMASLYPAAALGLDRQFGRIAPGYRASFVTIEDRCRVTRVWIDGDQYDID